MRILLYGENPDRTSSLAKLMGKGLSISHTFDLEGLITSCKLYEYDAVILLCNAKKQINSSFISSIRLNKIDLPIVLISSFADSAYLTGLLNSGLTDFIPMPIDQKYLQAKLFALMRSRLAKEKLDVWVGSLRLDFKHHQFSINDKIVLINVSEYQILEKLVLNQGSIVSFESLLNCFKEDNFNIRKETIRIYIYNLRKKIEKISNNGPFILTWHKQGYEIVEEVPEFFKIKEKKNQLERKLLSNYS